MNTIEVDNSERDPNHIIKILVASDIHLGYAEKDTVREHDSFIAFEEVLVNAVKYNVDFILLGGDLFHESKPSLYCFNRCIQLIKRYCFGDKIIEIEFLSKGLQHLRNAGIVNYEDPNLNISFPIFSIHGNHDDPIGKKQVSTMDLLSSTGYINYFGQCNNLSVVDIVPLIIRKGDTQLALYGLSHIHDQRLARLFHEDKVHFKPPPGNLFLHILVLHQNRANRGAKNFIPIECLPTFFDLIIWGHEHDCIIEPLLENDVYVSQPGSTVATSLAAGEALPKHCGLLLLNKREFTMRPQLLHSVRPFIFEAYDLPASTEPEAIPNNSDSNSSDNKQVDTLARRMGTLHPDAAESMRLIQIKVEEMIEQAKGMYKGPSESAPLPLVRLQVKYFQEYQVFNTIQFGQQYSGIVANPEDMVKMKEAPKKVTRSASKKSDTDFPDDEQVDPQKWSKSIDGVLRDFFKDEANQKLLVIFPAKSLIKALTQYVKKDDIDVFTIAIEFQIQTLIEQLNRNNTPEEAILETLQQMMAETTTTNNLERAWDSSNAAELLTSRIYDEVDDALDDIDLTVGPSLPTMTNVIATSSSRGRARGRSRGIRGRARARASR